MVENKENLRDMVLAGKTITEIYNRMSRGEKCDLSKYETITIPYLLIPNTVGIAVEYVMINGKEVKVFLVYEVDVKGHPCGISPLTTDLNYAIQDAAEYIQYLNNLNSKKNHKKGKRH